MSRLDADKWNERYRRGAYAERTNPSPFLERALAEHPPPGDRALDVACGAGRNALYLAAAGYQVDALDISEIALERAATAAAERGLRVCFTLTDLDEGIPDGPDYDLIVMVRYVNGRLLGELGRRLSSGGVLLVEQHLVSDAVVVGPGNPAFRVSPGELASQIPELDLVSAEEGLVTDPDGRVAALARVIARKRPPAFG